MLVAVRIVASSILFSVGRLPAGPVIDRGWWSVGTSRRVVGPRSHLIALRVLVPASSLVDVRCRLSGSVRCRSGLGRYPTAGTFVAADTIEVSFEISTSHPDDTAAPA